MSETEKRDVAIGVAVIVILILLYLLWRKGTVASAPVVQNPFLAGPQWAGGAPIPSLPALSVPTTPTYNIGQGQGFNSQPCACGTNTVA